MPKDDGGAETEGSMAVIANTATTQLWKFLIKSLKMFVSLLVLIACFSQARTLEKALPEIPAGRSGTNCNWLKLIPLRIPRELKLKPEVDFEVVHSDGRTLNASEFRDCVFKSAAGLVFRESGVGPKAQAVLRLTRTRYNTLQVIMSEELGGISRNGGRNLLVSLLCGERRFCIRFPDASAGSGRLTPQHLSRKFLSIKSEQDSSTQHYTMIVLVGVAGVIVLILTGALCVCGGEEITPPPARLISLSQTSLDGATKESVKESASNHPTTMGNNVDGKDESSTNREEIIKRQGSQASSRSDDAGQSNNVAIIVHSDVNAQLTNPVEHVGTAEPKRENSAGRKSRSHSSRSDNGTKPDEEHKDKKSKKSKRSSKNKRPTREAKDAQGHTNVVQAFLTVADRPRAPTPTSNSDPHSRELPPPPSIVNTMLPPVRQLSAPGDVEDDQYEVVEVKTCRRSASLKEGKASYETVNLRVGDCGKGRAVSIDSTYDVVGEQSSNRPASELYEVVDTEGRVNARIAVGEEEEDVTYEVVGGGEEAMPGLSSADAYEEVTRDAKARPSVKVESDEVDPKYSKVLQRLNVKADDNEADEVDPKYSKVLQRLNVKADDNEADEVDPKYSKVRQRVNAKAENNRDSVKKRENEEDKLQRKEDADTVAENTAGASVNQDRTYAEVQKDSRQERPRLLKHASTPEFSLEIATDSQGSTPPPAPSLNHLMEVAEAGRPHASSEGRRLQDRHTEEGSADLEVAQVSDYRYAIIDRSKKSSVSDEAAVTEGDGRKEDGDTSDEEPPPLPPIYVSMQESQEERNGEEGKEGSSDKNPADQTGLYDEVNPGPNTSVVVRVGDVPLVPRIVSTYSVDSDYETVEEMMKYTPRNAARSSQCEAVVKADTQSKETAISSDYETIQPAQVTINSPRENAQATLPEGEPHYEPVERREDDRSSSQHRAGSGKK